MCLHKYDPSRRIAVHNFQQPELPFPFDLFLFALTALGRIYLRWERLYDAIARGVYLRPLHGPTAARSMLVALRCTRICGLIAG
jgi:hypothetical protein